MQDRRHDQDDLVGLEPERRNEVDVQPAGGGSQGGAMGFGDSVREIGARETVECRPGT